jgi:ribosomal protein S21
MQVSLRDGESQESLLSRFQKRVQTSGILREFRAHRHFISKSEKARIAARKAARKIARRKQKREANERRWGR